MRLHEWLTLTTLLVASTAKAETPVPLLTGEVYSRQAQEIIVPLTTNWQSRISEMVPEGSFVEAGDRVVAFDGTEAARQLEQQRETTRTELAKTERDIARLEKELAQADKWQELAVVDLELATLKAGIPQGVIGAIEYAENQLGQEQSQNALENARAARADAAKALADRQEQAALDAQKVEIQERWWQQMLTSFEIRAQQPGYVIYGNHPWTRAKFQEGDNVQTSFRIAQVANTEDLAIKVWINGVDKPHVDAGDTVDIFLDALPGRRFNGTIESVSDSGAKRQEWGKADYFEAIVVLDNLPEDLLLPGMSALVEVKS